MAGNSNIETARTVDEAAWVVVFNARLTADQSGYADAARLLAERVKRLPGFIVEESFSDGDRLVSVTYWRDEESIRAWREDPEHRRVQAEAVERWYSEYSVFICDVSRTCAFPRPTSQKAR